MIDYPGMLSIWTSIDATKTSKIYAKIYVMTIFDERNIDEQDSEQQICEFAVQLIKYLDINCTSNISAGGKLIPCVDFFTAIETQL